ncbi:MAG: hypothetical protein ACHQFW_03035 [Chitinophagales bacterium]
MKKLITIFLLTFSIHNAFTQGPPPDMDEDKIEPLRIAFLTKYLELTTEEAQKFWPVYNNMRAELKVIMDSEKNLKNGKSINDMTDEELNKLINSHFENDQKILDLKKKYVAEFKKVIPLRKVALLADAENEFKRQMIQHANEKKQGPPPGGPGGNKPGGGGPHHE